MNLQSICISHVLIYMERRIGSGKSSADVDQVELAGSSLDQVFTRTLNLSSFGSIALRAFY